MPTIVNLTPHDIVLLNEDNSIREVFKPSGVVARAQMSTETVDIGLGYPTVRTKFGPPVDLPEYQEETYYIVSLPLVSSARDSGRKIDDLLTPGQQVRDEKGNIIGCRSLQLA